MTRIEAVSPIANGEVPSNNKPLSIKGPTIDSYNENKDSKLTVDSKTMTPKP